MASRLLIITLAIATGPALGEPPDPPAAPDTPSTPPTQVVPPPPAVPAPADPFPHLRIDRETKTIEFDGIVPIDAHVKASTKVYLEVIVCTPDTKEHESLVLTKVKPSHLHAALLSLGLQPGRPGAFEWKDKQLTSTPAAGPALDVAFIYNTPAGDTVEARPSEWVQLESTGRNLADSAPDGGFLFAGSMFIATDAGERYRADSDGTLIGLTTFGGETIAWSQIFSPQAEIQEPDWIADRTRVPPYNTPVKIRIRPAAEPSKAPPPGPSPAEASPPPLDKPEPSTSEPR